MPLERGFDVKKRLLAALLALPILAVILCWFSCSHQQASVAMTQEDRLSLADQLSSRGKCTQAILQYEKLLAEFPRPQVAETAKFNLARCRMDLGEYDLAVTEFEDFIDSYPRSNQVDDAMYMVGLCDLRQSPRVERDQSKAIEALNQLNLLLRKYPDTDVREAAEKSIMEARSRLAEKEYLNGQLYLKLRDYKSAGIYFDYVISEYGGTPWAQQALVAKGMALEGEGKPDEAGQVYQRVIKDFPSSGPADQAARRLKELGGGSDKKTETSSQ